MALISLTSIEDSLDALIISTLKKLGSSTAYAVSRKIDEVDTKVMYRLDRLVDGGLVIKMKDEDKGRILYKLNKDVINIEDGKIFITTKVCKICINLDEIMGSLSK